MKYVFKNMHSNSFTSFVWGEKIYNVDHRWMGYYFSDAETNPFVLEWNEDKNIFFFYIAIA